MSNKKGQGVEELPEALIAVTSFVIIMVIIWGLVGYPGLNWFNDIFMPPKTASEEYITAKQSTDALFCAINSVALGGEWEGDGIDCKKSTDSLELLSYDNIERIEENIPVNSNIDTEKECEKACLDEFCEGMPGCTVKESTALKLPSIYQEYKDDQFCNCKVDRPEDTVTKCDTEQEDLNEMVYGMAFAGVFVEPGELDLPAEERNKMGVTLDTDACEEYAELDPKITVKPGQSKEPRETNKEAGEIYGGKCGCEITFDKPLILNKFFSLEEGKLAAEFIGHYLKVLEKKSDEDFWLIDITGDGEGDAYLWSEKLEGLGVQPVETGATIPEGDIFTFKIYRNPIDYTKWEIKIPDFNYVNGMIIYTGLYLDGGIEIPITGILNGLVSGNLEYYITSPEHFEEGQVFTTKHLEITEKVWEVKIGDKEYNVTAIDFTGDMKADNIWDTGTERSATNAENIKRAFSLDEVKEGVIEGAEADLGISHIVYDKAGVPKTLQISVYNEFGAIDTVSIPADDFMDGINYGFVTEKNITPSNVFSINTFGFFPGEAEQTCKKIFDGMDDAEKSLENVENLLVYRKLVLSPDYIPAPVSYSCSESFRGGNEYPIKVKEFECSLQKSNTICYIYNFNLPQDMGNSDIGRKLVRGVGDPNFVLYYEAFPEGEEAAWMIDPDDFLMMSMFIGAGLNIIPWVGSVASKGVAKVTGKSLSAILRGVIGKMGKLLTFGFRKAGATIIDALATLSDKPLKKFVREGMENTIQATARRTAIRGGLGKTLTRTQAGGLARAIMNRAQKGMGADDMVDDLFRYYTAQAAKGEGFALGVDKKVLRKFLDKQVKTEFSKVVGTVVKNNAGDVARAVKSLHLDQAIDGIFMKEGGKSFSDDFFRPVIREIVESDVSDELVPDLLRKAVTRLSAVEKAAIKTNIRTMLATAAKRIANLPSDAWDFIKNNQKEVLEYYITHSMSLHYHTIQALDEAGMFQKIPASKELTECFILMPGTWSKAACLFLQSTGILLMLGDKSNEKYKSHGLNTLVLHRTIYPEDVYDLSSEANQYYLQLNRPDNIWKGGGPQRLYFASPCKVNLKIYETTAECGLESCDYKGIAKEECKDKLGNEYKECEESIKNNVCGHLPASKEYTIFGKTIYSKDYTFYSKYPLYMPGIPVASVDRDKYPEWSSLPEDAMGIKMCNSRSMLGDAWNEIKKYPFLWPPYMQLFIKPDIEPLEVPAINIEPIGDIEGFCFQGDDHKTFLYKSIALAGTIVVDIGVAALTVATGGATAPLFFATGAGAAYLDVKIDKIRAWPNNPANN